MSGIVTMARSLAWLQLVLWWMLACGQGDATLKTYVPVVVRMNVEPVPVAASQNATISVAFVSLKSDLPMNASTFETAHDRALHLVAVGRDLDTFAHLHPPRVGPGSSFVFNNISFPLSGRYIVGFDGQLPTGAVSNHTLLDVVGQPAMNTTAYSARSNAKSILVHSVPLRDSDVPATTLSTLIASDMDSTSPLLGTYKVVMNGPRGANCKPGTELTYQWSFFNATSNAPLTDMHTYLAAPMHLAVVAEDLSFIAHEHGVIPNGNIVAVDGNVTGGEGDNMPGMEGMVHGATQTFGPNVTTVVVVPKAGTYLLVGQASRGDEIILAPFVISCDGERATDVMGHGDANTLPSDAANAAAAATIVGRVWAWSLVSFVTLIWW